MKCKRCQGSGVEPDPNRCSASNGQRGRCTEPAVAEVEITMVGREAQWRKYCQKHVDGLNSCRRVRPLSGEGTLGMDFPR